MINKKEAANSMSLRGQRKVHLKDLYAIVDWLCTGTKDEPAEERMEDNGHVDADTQTHTDFTAVSVYYGLLNTNPTRSDLLP